MIRILLLLAIAFSIPFLVNILWLQWRQEAEGFSRLNLALAGIGLAFIAMFTLVFLETRSSSYDGVYQPPVLEDGQVRPGHFNDPDPDPETDAFEG